MKIKKIHVGITIIIAVVLVMNISIKAEKFEKIDFPQFAGYVDHELKFEDKSNKSNVKNADIAKHVYVVKEEISKKKSDHIKQVFDMVNFESKKDDVQEVITGNDKVLTIYKNGTYHYKNKITKTDKVKITDEECKKIALDFLETNDLMPEYFEYAGTGYDILTPMDNPQDETIIAKSIYFRRSLNGVDVKGNSKIYVTVVNDGAIRDVYSSYREIEDEILINDVVSPFEAIEKAKNFDGMVAIDEKANKVKITEVEMIFWEDSAPLSENATIQPVYKVTGKCFLCNEEIGDFEAIVSALPDEMIKKNKEYKTSPTEKK